MSYIMASMSLSPINSPSFHGNILIDLQKFLEFMIGPTNGRIALPATMALHIPAIKAIMNKQPYALDYYTSFRENLKERKYLLPEKTDLIKMIDSVCGPVISDNEEYEEAISNHGAGTHRTLMCRGNPDIFYDARFEFCKVLYISIYRA